MNVERITEPQSEPVTLDEAKGHLRIVDFDDDNNYIDSLIAAARRAVEDMTGRVMLDTVFAVTYRGWTPWLPIPRGQARSIDQLEYRDTAGDWQTVASENYELSPYGDGCADIVLLDTFDEPDLYDPPRVDNIRATITAGYGLAAADIPQPLRQAVLYLVAHLYENRSPVGINITANKIPFTVEALAGPYKIYN